MNMKDEGKSLEEGFSGKFIALFLSSLVFACFITVCRNKIPNLLLYAASSLIFFACYFALAMITKRHKAIVFSSIIYSKGI